MLIVITGVIAYVTMPREDFPEIIENKVYISSVFPGNSAEDVEKLIIKPLEKEFKNISGVEKITSNSFQDYGMIIVEFSDNVTIEDAKTKIKDKVDVKKADSDWPNLDNGSKVEPNVFELNISEEVPILNINLKGNYTTQQLKKYGELLQDDIEEIAEVKKVDILGVDDKEVEIAVDIFKMGANHQREIEGYCMYTQPTHGLITNCGKAHLEGFGGIEGVKKGKGELFDYLRKNNGTAFVM
jgi:multidrug efflux pump subunit AcrB